MSEHIDPAQGLMLVAMSEDEPELSAARAHAAVCADCRALLAESAQMLQLFELSEPSPTIEPALKARIEQKLFGRRWSGSHFAVAALALLSFVLAWKNGHPHDYPTAQAATRCALFESGYALAPLLIGVAVTRLGKLQLSPARFASYTMAFGVLGQFLLRGHCEAHDLSLHLFVAHFLVVLALGLVGAGTARLLATSR